jgi:hypothetical protein
MFPSGQCASDKPHVRAEQTSHLHKEALEFLHRPWCQQPAVSPELFLLGPGAAARNLPAAECGVSS